MERKEKERERRLQMKELCFQLSSLIPKHRHRQQPSLHIPSSNSKDILIQQDSLDEAVTYISQLKQRVEHLKKIKDSKIAVTSAPKKIASASPSNPTSSNNEAAPIIEVRSEDTNLEVILISTLHNRFDLHRIIGILDEEGTNVKNANVSVDGDKVFYTIHSQGLSSRIGLEASRVLERLRNLVS